MVLRPYYLFPAAVGDTEFHLARARDILENPFFGLLWDNLTYQPLGRPVWHQPLFNAVYALFWYFGGVRFAQSIMCFLQVLLTVGVASWFAKKEYGLIAGFFAGFFALFVPAVNSLCIPMPAAFVPILAVLTIYYIPKDKKKAFVTSLLGLWTHMVSLACFIPLFLVDNYKDKSNLKIIALLLPFILFWAGYWIYFRDRIVSHGLFYSITHPQFLCTDPSQPTFYIQISIFFIGFIGLYILYKRNYRQFKLFLTYILIVIVVSFFGFNGDFLRGFQFSALPIAILSALAVQKGYEYLNKNYKKFVSILFILLILLYSLLGTIIYVGNLPNKEIGQWNNIDKPFEGDYYPLTIYIDQNTDKNQTIWTDKLRSEKLAWMTGRKISNGFYPNDEYGGTTGFKEQFQNINIYVDKESFIIKNKNNIIIKEIPHNLNFR